MKVLVIENVRIFDGSGAQPFWGEIRIVDDLIVAVARGGEKVQRDGATTIDGGGGFLMPGLVESHAHLGFGSTVHHVADARMADVPTKLMLMTHAARVMLDHGWTSLYSGGAANAAAEVALRNAIAAGIIPGPRLRACSFERSASAVSGGNQSTAYAGIGGRAPDAEGMFAFVEEMADLGCDSVKLVLTGESGVRPGTSRVIQFHEEEVEAAAAAARGRGIWMNVHAHSAESVKIAVRNGFRAIYHATWADEEAIDLLEEAKDRLFVAPGPGINWANIHEGAAWGITEEVARQQEQYETLERTTALTPELLKRGVRVLPGGDYGFPWNPIGKNARDLQLFVELYGLSPVQTLVAATKWGGQLMDLPVGEIRESYLADLLIVDGDPLANIRLLQDPSRFRLIMLGGNIHLDRRPQRDAA